MNINKEHYDRKYVVDVDYRYKTNTRYQRFLVKRLEKYITCDEISSVCDIGCGPGLNTVFFVTDFPRAFITGIDISSTGIEHAQNRYRNYSRLKFECRDVMDHDFSGEKYDIITAFELLEHIEKWEELGEIMTKSATK